MKKHLINLKFLKVDWVHKRVKNTKKILILGVSMHEELKGWLEWLGIEDPQLEALHGDASARRYYRLQSDDSTGMVMDASDLKESVPVFIGVAWRLMDAKVRIPVIKAYELNKGFIFWKI